MQADIEQYSYDLPDERIARFPLDERDASRLLIWKNGQITHSFFKHMPILVPENALLVFNNSKVIPARMLFEKKTGAKIEIFLLEPGLSEADISTVMKKRGTCVWKCLIGNRKRWKPGEVLYKAMNINNQNITLSAIRPPDQSDEVRFEWPGSIPFNELIDAMGQTPLPPYLKRAALPSDRERYQTIYSEKDGAVAAPTAGLHFTPKVLLELKNRGVRQEFLTLHVSAGTFRPVKEADFRRHEMHSEQISIAASSLETILMHQGPVIAVGTTSLRILESLYWMGVKVLEKQTDPFRIEKLFPYWKNQKELPSSIESLSALKEYMANGYIDPLQAQTEIFIFPGYEFKICRGLITNFHMPRSTLLLLIAAFTDDDWKKIYAEAMSLNYRFLSYGDSSLLLK